jgi:copper transport protein
VRAGRAGLAALVVCLVSLLPAAPAWAHAALLETTPADGVVLQQQPREIVLRYSEPVSTSLGAVKVLAPDGTRVDTGQVTTRAGRTEVVAPLRDGLATGTYLLVWRVVSEDSHPVSGASTFSIGQESAVADAPEQSGGGAAGTLLTISRLLTFTGLVLLVGGALFLLVLWPPGQQVAAARRVLWAGWSLAVAGTVAGLLLQGPYAAGLPLSSALNGEVLRTRFGAASATRLGLLAAAAALLSLLARGKLTLLLRTEAALVGAGLLFTTSLVGHASVGEMSAIALPADAIHLGAAATWLGGLIVLATVLLRRTDPAQLALVLPRWSRWAAGAVAVLVATGLFASWREVRELEAVTTTTYGRLLLVKLTLVAGMVALGALGRSWVRRHYVLRVVHAATGDADLAFAVPPAAAVQRLRRSVLLEGGTAAVVLVVTAGLVETTPARTAYAPVFTETKAVTGPLQVQVDVEPARAGLNQMHVYYTGAGGKAVDVEEVTARLTHPAGDVISVQVHYDTLGHYEQLRVPLPYAGQWRLDLTTRTSDIDSYTTTFTFRVR